MRLARVCLASLMAAPAAAVTTPYVSARTVATVGAGYAEARGHSVNGATTIAGPGGTASVTPAAPVGASAIAAAASQTGASQVGPDPVTAQAAASVDAAAASLSSRLAAQRDANGSANVQLLDVYAFANTGVPAWVRTTFTLAVDQSFAPATAATRAQISGRFGGASWVYNLNTGADGETVPDVRILTLGSPTVRNATVIPLADGYRFQWESRLAGSPSDWELFATANTECAGRFDPTCRIDVSIDAAIDLSRADIQGSSALGSTRFGVYSAAPDPVTVPEPGTWALLLLGFGGVGTMARRRHPAAA